MQPGPEAWGLYLLCPGPAAGAWAQTLSGRDTVPGTLRSGRQEEASLRPAWEHAGSGIWGLRVSGRRTDGLSAGGAWGPGPVGWTPLGGRAGLCGHPGVKEAGPPAGPASPVEGAQAPLPPPSGWGHCPLSPAHPEHHLTAPDVLGTPGRGPRAHGARAELRGGGPLGTPRAEHFRPHPGFASKRQEADMSCFCFLHIYL